MLENCERSIANRAEHLSNTGDLKRCPSFAEPGQGAWCDYPFFADHLSGEQCRQQYWSHERSSWSTPHQSFVIGTKTSADNLWSGQLLSVAMKTRTILEKLSDVERALQRGDSFAAYSLLREVEDSVLKMRDELIESRNAASPHTANTQSRQ